MRIRHTVYSLLLLAPLLMAVLPGSVSAAGEAPQSMEQLAAQRAGLARELEQVEAALAVLHKDGGSPWESTDATVRALADKAVALKQEMLDLTERELSLRKDLLRAPQGSTVPAGDSASTDSETQAVQRLRDLIAAYYADLQRSELGTPTPDQLAERKAELEQSRALANVHIDPGKLLLNGIEGNVLLRQMTEHLADPSQPEYRRQTAPICSIRTRRQGSLVASHNRSLQPVGKHLYVAEVSIASGNTTLRVQNNEWTFDSEHGSLPQHYLVTLNASPDRAPEMHLISVAALQSASNAQIPVWLPTALLQSSEQ